MKLVNKFFAICALSTFSFISFSANSEVNDATVATTNQDQNTVETTPYVPKTGDDIYVSDKANIWVRSCPNNQCRVIGVKHVGDKLAFVRYSEDKKYILVDDGQKQTWMREADLQFEPCGKAKIVLLEEEINKLKEDLANYDSNIAKDYRATKAKVEKLEEENAKLKAYVNSKNETIEDLDSKRRDYAEKLETKELDMQMRWWIQGAVIAICGALFGIILVYIPRPNSRRRKDRF